MYVIILIGCLCNCVSTSPMHLLMIERGVNIYMDGWSSWNITHHQKQRLKVPQLSFLHTRSFVQCCVAIMDVIPLLGYLYNGAWMFGAHGKQWCHPHHGLCCYTRNNMPWMGCHPFHMFCGCMATVWQAWDVINILGFCSFKPQSTQAVGPDVVRTAEPPSHP